MRFGQDERAFKAYAMYASTWKVDGIHAERDKNDGPGNMLSAFQSYIFGYGMAIPDNLHQKVNELRNGEEYAAVSELYGSTMKMTLQSSPFSVLFKYGKEKCGCWGYQRMICQLEDCGLLARSSPRCGWGQQVCI